MASKARAFTFAELQIVTSLSRGEIRECVKRGMDQRARQRRTGDRAYSKWNLVQGVIAAALLRPVRAGSVQALMTRLQLNFFADDIDPEAYRAAPGAFAFAAHYPPRTKPDDKVDRKPGEDNQVARRAILDLDLLCRGFSVWINLIRRAPDWLEIILGGAGSRDLIDPRDMLVRF
jgi:hypothetical protein